MAQDVLNTKSSYNTSQPVFQTARTYEIVSYISHLEAEEQRLYMSIGCSNYQDFIAKLRVIFSQQNMDVLKKFSPENLKRSVTALSAESSSLLGQTVKFTFDFTAINDLKLKKNIVESLRSNYGSNPDFVINEVTADKGDITFQFNSERAKKVLNEIFKGRKFDIDSLNIKAAEGAVRLLQASGVLNIEVAYNAQNVWTTWTTIDIPNFPWGVTVDYIDMIKKTGNVAAKDALKRAVLAIRKFIIDLAATGTEELKAAVIETWYSIAKDEDPAIFFQGTQYSNFLGSVQGALGEFQAAVIFTFLKNTFRTSGIDPKILGNAYSMLNTGELPKTDVQLFGSLGIQVKNVKTVTDKAGNVNLMEDLKTNIHPSKIAQYLGSQADDFLNFIANYYFNISFQQASKGIFDSMVKMLKSYIGAVMNLSVKAGISDTVSFYMIGAKYLVPGSVILKAAIALGENNALEVTSSYQGREDDQYNERTILRRHRTGKTSSSFSPEWTKYWRGKETLYPTEKNRTTFNNLISRRISIRSDLSFLRDIQSYALIV